MAGGAAVLGGIALALPSIRKCDFAASTKKKLEEMKIKRKKLT